MISTDPDSISQFSVLTVLEQTVYVGFISTHVTSSGEQLCVLIGLQEGNCAGKLKK